MNINIGYRWEPLILENDPGIDAELVPPSPSPSDSVIVPGEPVGLTMGAPPSTSGLPGPGEPQPPVVSPAQLLAQAEDLLGVLQASNHDEAASYAAALNNAIERYEASQGRGVSSEDERRRQRAYEALIVAMMEARRFLASRNDNVVNGDDRRPQPIRPL